MSLGLPPEHKVKLLKRSNRQTLCSRQSLSTYVHVGNVAKSECAMDGADERPAILPCVEEFVGNRRVPFLFGYFDFGHAKKSHSPGGETRNISPNYSFGISKCPQKVKPDTNDG